MRQGLAVLKSPTRLAGVVAWSVVLWLVNALSFYLAFFAFDLPVSYTGAVVLQGVLAFGIAVPSAPGYVGPFEAVITAVLALYGIGASQAVAYAVGYHLTTFVPITVLGVWSATRTGLGLVRHGARRPAKCLTDPSPGRRRPRRTSSCASSRGRRRATTPSRPSSACSTLPTT